MNKIEFKRRLGATLVDKILIMVLFIILLLVVSPYGTPGILGRYTVLMNLSPSEYYDQKLFLIDQLITSVFIIVNFIYFLLSEFIFRASPGKRMFGLIVLSKNSTVVNKRRILKRNLIFLCLMITAVLIRYILDTNYVIAIIFFFIILDIPVFIKNQSLIDLISNTFIIRRKYYEKHI